jgi:hypothetical protein
MKTCQILLTIAALFLCTASFAQITLTQNDAPPFGNVWTSHMTMNLVEVDHGPAGANQTWSYEAFPWDMSSTTETVDPTSTAYTGSFPTATHAFHDPDGGVSYSYIRVAANGYYMLGWGSPDTVNVLNPEWLQIMFPCTYGSNWTSVQHVEHEIAPGIMYYMTDSTRITVDAWGHITTPYGSVDCLRAFWHNWTISQFGPLPPNTSENVGYSWYGNHSMDLMHITSDNDVTDPNFTQGMVEMSERILAVDPPRGPLAQRFAVSQNYPNPFNPTTTLPVELAQSTRVTLSIYDETGRLVSNEAFMLSPGQHNLPIDGSKWATGTYFARVAAAGQEQTMKMQLVK